MHCSGPEKEPSYVALWSVLNSIQMIYFQLAIAFANLLYYSPLQQLSEKVSLELCISLDTRPKHGQCGECGGGRGSN